VADYVNVNGQIVRYDEVGIAPSDAGVLHGAGLFETMRVRNRKVFRGRQHLERMMNSAGTLGIPVSLSLAQLQEMVEDLSEVNGFSPEQDVRARLTVTRGDLHAVTAENPVPPVTLILSVSAFGAYPAELYAKGMTVAVSAYKQNPENPLTGHKTTSYFDRLLGLRAAQELKCGEAFWFTAGTNYLAEGSISNVFLVDKEGILATPPLVVPPPQGKANQRMCLPGVTRGVVMEAATSMNVLVHERLLTIEDVLGAREIFLTNAIMGVMPVTAVEKHVVGNGKVGEMTIKLREGYSSLFDEGIK